MFTRHFRTKLTALHENFVDKKGEFQEIKASIYIDGKLGARVFEKDLKPHKVTKLYVPELFSYRLLQNFQILSRSDRYTQKEPLAE